LFCHLAFPLGEEDDDIDVHTRKLEEVLEVYEQRLSDNEFLVGNKFTLADLVHLPNSHYIKASNKFLYLYDSRKNVRRWWDAISDRSSWKKVLRYMKSVEEKNKQEELKK
jgi:glutathione S-transferase